MVHGRVTRSIALQDTTGVLNGSCFLRDNTAVPPQPPSIVCAVAAPALQKGHLEDTDSDSYSYTLSMVAARYGLVAPAGSKIAATDLLTGEALGTFEPANVTVSGTLAAFDLRVIKLTIANS